MAEVLMLAYFIIGYVSVQYCTVGFSRRTIESRLEMRTMGKFCFNCGKQLKPSAVFCSNCGTKIAKSSTAPSDHIADRLAPAAGVLAGAAVVAVEESAHAQTTNVANAAAAAPPNELTGEAVTESRLITRTGIGEREPHD